MIPPLAFVPSNERRIPSPTEASYSPTLPPKLPAAKRPSLVGEKASEEMMPFCPSGLFLVGVVLMR